MMFNKIVNFIEESNSIEGINREPTQAEITAHKKFFALQKIEIQNLTDFVSDICGALIRNKDGMDVRVGKHIPQKGGPEVIGRLKIICDLANSHITKNHSGLAYQVHCEYENLHPYMDGNGRSGRALWAWMQLKNNQNPFWLGFLHNWYYESLNQWRFNQQKNQP